MVITYVPAFFNAVEVWVQVRVTCMATSPHSPPFIRLHTPSPPFSHALCHLSLRQALERVKWASQLGATAKLRTTHARIYRTIDKMMKEPWHKPQVPA